MTAPERAALDAFAAAEGVSAGEVVRLALREYLSQKQDRASKPAGLQKKS